jgi:hypothetical protein
MTVKFAASLHYPGFDDPMGGCPRTQHVGGQRQSRQALAGADGFAVFEAGYLCWPSVDRSLQRGAVENLRTFRDVLFMLRELDREQRANVVGERRREFAALSTGRSWLHSWAAEIHGK